MKFSDITKFLGSGISKITFKHDVMTTDDVRAHSDKPIGNVGIVASLLTQKADCVTDFEDAAMSDLAKSEVYDHTDLRKTGEFMGHSLVRSAHDAIIPIVSLYAHTLSYNMGKKEYELLKPGYTFKDVKRVAMQEVKLEDNDFRAQAALDNAKNANDLSIIFKSGKPQPTTHESDLWHRSGTKEMSTKDAEGRLVTKYKADYRSVEHLKKFVDRSHSSSPDAMLLDKIKNDTPDGLYFNLAVKDGVDSDAQGIPYLALNAKGIDRLDLNVQLDRAQYLFPCEFRLTGTISAESFEIWNRKSADEQKVPMRTEKDIDKWQLCDVAYKLYKSKKPHNAEEAAKALEYMLEEVGALIVSITQVGDYKSEEYKLELAHFLANTALFRAIPKDVNLGITESEMDKPIQFSRAKMITFQQMAEVFGSFWLSASQLDVDVNELAEDQKKKALEDLLTCVAAKKKKYSSDREEAFTHAIYEVDEDSFEVD